jgi:hypothetical protein
MLWFAIFQNSSPVNSLMDQLHNSTTEHVCILQYVHLWTPRLHLKETGMERNVVRQ